MAGFAGHALRVNVSMARDGVPLRIQKGQLGPNGEKPGTFAFTGGPGSQSQSILDRNRGLALQAQRSIGQELNENILRPDVKTGRLFRATMDRDNIAWDRFGFAVGDPEFLDRSQAKYWRTIDQGTAHWKKPFVGSTFYVNKARAFGSTIAYFNNDRSFAGPDWSRAGKATGGKMNPLTRAAGNAIIDENEGIPPRWLGVLHIKHDIVAKQYYLEGFRRSGVIDLGVSRYFAEFAKFMP